MYMIVTKDKYRLPLYWGETVAELAENAHLSYRIVKDGVWKAIRGERKNTKYEVVRIPEDE